MVTVAVALPPELLAVTVYVAVEVIVVGVPEIVPVDVSNSSPVGNAGETDHEVTVPPLADGVAVVLAIPFVRVNGLPLNATPDGAASLTRIEMVTVALPPVLVAVTV